MKVKNEIEVLKVVLQDIHKPTIYEFCNILTEIRNTL